MTEPPKLATGDGSLGFWLALSKDFPQTKHQRCWVHKTANVLDKLHGIWMSATGEDVTKPFDRFIEVYGTKWPRASACLEKHCAEPLALYDFPAEHWQHLRTTNPIERLAALI